LEQRPSLPEKTFFFGITSPQRCIESLADEVSNNRNPLFHLLVPFKKLLDLHCEIKRQEKTFWRKNNPYAKTPHRIILVDGVAARNTPEFWRENSNE